MHNASLRRQLLNWLLGPIIIVLLLGSAIAYMFAKQAAMNAYDLGLLDNALDLSRQVEVYNGELTIDLPPVAQQMLQVNNDDVVTYAAWDDVGHLFSGSHSLLTIGALPANGSHIFRYAKVDGEENREVLLRGSHAGKDFYIAVSQTMHNHNHLMDDILASILLPEALLSIICVAAILIGVKRGLLPIHNLRNEIISRSSTDLRPIAESPAPAELAPIVHGVNELLSRLATAFAAHRRFIADAAHQLRTPLASLRSQIEVGLESPPPDVKILLRQLLETTQRTTHLTNQLLSLARLEHTEQTRHEVVEVNLQQIFLDASADIVSLAARKGVEISFDIQLCKLWGSPLMLRELLVNLLSNALRYSPPGKSVTVTLRSTPQEILLSVEDNGPGVPENELLQLGVPFHRLPSTEQDGCGLGLAIVREIARLHRAEIDFKQGSGGQGLLVNVRFPTIITPGGL